MSITTHDPFADSSHLRLMIPDRPWLPSITETSETGRILIGLGFGATDMHPTILEILSSAMQDGPDSNIS